MYAFLGDKPHLDEAIVHAGYGLGYGNVCSQGQVHMSRRDRTRDTDMTKWLHPIVDNTDLDARTVTDRLSSGSENNASLDANVVPARRGRGRPRVNTPRDESAVEVATKLLVWCTETKRRRNVGLRYERHNVLIKNEKIVPQPPSGGGATMCCKSSRTFPWTWKHCFRPLLMQE
jgi:hypothetical protein